MREIALIEAEDGLAFDVAGATAESIRDEDEYTGVRISIVVRLATAILPLHIDVNVGDPAWPAPAVIEVPRLLGGSIAITGYPVAMVHAEKIVTAIQRGIANTRWRDFADIHTLSNRHPVEGSDLQTALQTVAGARAAQLIPLADRLRGYPERAQGRWAAWRPGGESTASTRPSRSLSAMSSPRSPLLPTPPCAAR
ncbi:hypothetical protein GCM10009547_48180 [Sporichthya brevicatena]|uniref:Uncharacterized protein n=1 Tax=Sporichthya brevicatena TaxID=171442 RepID=A0ABN1HDM2_9ACTN